MPGTDRQEELKERWLNGVLELIEECDSREGRKWLIGFYKELLARDAKDAYEVERDYRKLQKRERRSIR